MESILSEINDLIKEFEESKKSNQELSEFNALLQEELRVARALERSAEARKTRCQTFLNQQQEVIQRLLVVKEENENLKCKLIQAEKNLEMIQNNSIEEQMRKDAKIQEIEQEYLKKNIKVQEDADQQVEKVKSEYSFTVSDLKASVSKLEKKLEEKDALNASLQEEVQTLKEWAEANIEAFHQKLAEQERKHQAELETWKMAELNRTASNQVQQNNPATLYGSGQNYQQVYQTQQSTRFNHGYQPNMTFQEKTPSYQKTPLVTHYKNEQPRNNTNLVRPLTTTGSYQNKSEFLSANEVYYQRNQSIEDDKEGKNENSGEKSKENKKPIMPQKPKILVPNKKRKLFNGNQNFL